MRTRMYGGVRGRKTKVGGKPTFCFPPTRLKLVVAKIRESLTCLHRILMGKYCHNRTCLSTMFCNSPDVLRSGSVAVCYRFAIIPTFCAKIRGLLHKSRENATFSAIIPEFCCVFRGVLQMRKGISVDSATSDRGAVCGTGCSNGPDFWR